MKYEIRETVHSDGSGVIMIATRGFIFYNMVWAREFAAEDREYARLCAKELVEHLTAKI